jgi:hypothetical protein
VKKTVGVTVALLSLAVILASYYMRERSKSSQQVSSAQQEMLQDDPDGHEKDENLEFGKSEDPAFENDEDQPFSDREIRKGFADGAGDEAQTHDEITIESELRRASSRMRFLNDATSAKDVQPERESIGSIHGWVTDLDGNPVADAIIGARGQYGEGAGSSGSDGSFEISITSTQGTENTTTEEALFHVIASKQGYVSASSMRIALNTSDVPLVLTEGSEIHGFVIDAYTGKPIPEFQARIVRVETTVEGIQHSGDRWTGFENVHGEFALTSQRAPYELEAQAEGYAARLERVYVENGEPLTNFTIELVPGASIRGRVVDGDSNEPIENVQLGVNSGIYAPWDFGKPDSYQTSTDADGFFVLNGKVEGETVDLRFHHADYAPAFLIAHPTDWEDTGTVHMRKTGASVRGIASRGGVVLTGHRVHLTNSFGRPHSSIQSSPNEGAFYKWTHTNGAGEFAIGALPAGRYLLRLIDTDPTTPLVSRYLAREWVELGEGETVELPLIADEYGRIGGVLYGLDSYADVSVSLRDMRWPDEFMYLTGEKHGSNGPNEMGEFLFGPTPAGEYVVYVHVPQQGDRIIEYPCAVGVGEVLELPIDLNLEDQLEEVAGDAVAP